MKGLGAVCGVLVGLGAMWGRGEWVNPAPGGSGLTLGGDLRFNASNAYDVGSVGAPARTGYFHTVVVASNSLQIGPVKMTAAGTNAEMRLQGESSTETVATELFVTNRTAALTASLAAESAARAAVGTELERNSANDAWLAFSVYTDRALSVTPMADGFRDGFADTNGIAAGGSNYVWSVGQLAFGASGLQQLFPTLTGATNAIAEEYGWEVYPSWQFFDGQTNTINGWLVGTFGVITGWVQFAFSSPVVADSYSLFSRGEGDNRAIKSWQVLAGPDSDNLVVVDTQTGVTDWYNAGCVRHDYEFVASVTGTVWRLAVTEANDPNYTGMDEWMLFAFVPPKNAGFITQPVPLDFVPTEGRLFLAVDAPTCTAGVDVVGWVSRDAGTNWTSVLLEDDGALFATGTVRRWATSISNFVGGASQSNLVAWVESRNKKSGTIRGLAVQCR